MNGCWCGWKALGPLQDLPSLCPPFSLFRFLSGMYILLICLWMFTKKQYRKLKLLFVSLEFSWGYVVLNLGAGYLWGLWIGQVVVASSAAVGTFLATHVLRWAGVSWIEEQVSTNPQMASLLAVLNGPQAFKVLKASVPRRDRLYTYALQIVTISLSVCLCVCLFLQVIILTRLTPIPYGLQNAVFSMVHISMSSYMFATVVGLFPTQLLNTYFGTTLHSVEDVLRVCIDMTVVSQSVCVCIFAVAHKMYVL